METAPPARRRFDWLRDPGRRSQGLRQVEIALARRWLAPGMPEAAELRDAVEEILGESTLRPAQRPRLAAILARLG